MNLSGTTVLITGASSGIGRASALAFAAAGANVVATARRADRLQALCDDIGSSGGQAVFYAGDASQEASAIAAIELAQRHFGGLHILINNAGAGEYKPLVQTSAADFDTLMNTNMRSSFLFSRHVAPLMIERKSGIILFISSVVGLQGAANEAVYCATKFAQVGFSQALDAELRPYGIRVGVLCPGGVKSEFALGKGRTHESLAASKLMQPEDVAQAIVYSCSQPPNTRIPQMIVRHMG